MIKIAGSVLLVAAGGAAGMLVAREYARRPSDLKSMIASIQMLETEIIYAASPLAGALERVAQASDRRVADFFKRASQNLESMSEFTAGEAWENALSWYYSVSSLSRQDISILSSLGRSLGISDREDQAKHLKLACGQLKRELDSAEEAASKNARLWNYLGFCGALTAAIILY